MTATTVLLVEDDPDLQTTTRLVLEKHGFVVTVVGNGTDALELTRRTSFDVGLFDIMLPGIDGLRLTRLVREDGIDLPIVLLTARDLSDDMIRGLDAGADDYVTKPFDGDVLAARLRAVIRRGRSAAAPEPDLLSYGDLTIDLPGMTVQRDGEDLALSATEFRLLEALIINPGIVMSRSRLMEIVWGASDWAEERIVDVNIQRLRAKVGAEVIETVRGAGYKTPRL